jgi:hypothetical protein
MKKNSRNTPSSRKLSPPWLSLPAWFSSAWKSTRAPSRTHSIPTPLETAAYQDLVSQILTINNVWDSDPYLSNLTDRGIRGELTDPVEVSMFRSYAITVSRHADMACFQYQQGILSEGRLASALAIYMNQLALGNNNVLTDIDRITAILPGLQDCIELVRPYFQARRLPL